MIEAQKIEIPQNFRFADADGSVGGSALRAKLRDLGADVFHLEFKRAGWRQLSQTPLNKDAFRTEKSEASFELGSGHRFRLEWKGAPLLESFPSGAFGVSGKKWMLRFAYDPGDRFYGLGQKYFPFERTGAKTQFWNVDVFGAFAHSAIENATVDPGYVSIPYLILKRGDTYVGILVENPHRVFMAINPLFDISGQKDIGTEEQFYVGSTDGTPSLFFLVGPTLAELTQKFQRLCGLAGRPPLWSLGHQQCRWGYGGAKDLREVRDGFREHGIPNNGLWLDIDYMDAYKVFTFSEKQFAEPATEIAELQKDGAHVVPILDPGVKREKGYAAYDSARKSDVLCRNTEGGDYVGYVWPGETVFPDFSTEAGREWWAAQVEAFAKNGIHGVWLDMNDPSTGPSTQDEMRFGRGKEAHASFHNQYATGMARATYEGLRRAHPDRRPFLLSRSAYTGSGRWTAAWTGDNWSNFRNLRVGIHMSMGLSICGVPYVGPDVPGFSGAASAELAVRWYQAGFLFPFLRNHSGCYEPRQEPWEFGRDALIAIRDSVRWRYKLLPYLYQLAIENSRSGDPLLRPLLYDFESSRGAPLERLEDQFMIGPSLMQAPVVEEGGTGRTVTLPAGHWYDLGAGEWIRGNRKVEWAGSLKETAVYFREGALVPMQRGLPKDHHVDLSKIELHCFLRPGSKSVAETTYEFDDGQSYGFAKGAYSRVRVRARVRGRRLCVEFEAQHGGFGPLSVVVVACSDFEGVTATVDGGEPMKLPLRQGSQSFGPNKTVVYRTRQILVGETS